jgi:hypothetical protein
MTVQRRIYYPSFFQKPKLLCENFAKTKNFAKVFEKTKILLKFDSDTAAVLAVPFFFYTELHFRKKKNICVEMLDFSFH